MEDEYGRAVPWVYESTLTDPNGIKVQVIVTVSPVGHYGTNTDECGEVAQMTATTAMRHIRTNRQEHFEKAPF